MTARRHISATRRAKLFRDKGGICHLCGGIVHVGKPWDVSHTIPLALGGADDETNWGVAHRECHRAHTATQDQPAIAKAKRREIANVGARPAPVRKITSRDFPPGKPKREPKPTPPRRNIFTGMPI